MNPFRDFLTPRPFLCDPFLDSAPERLQRKLRQVRAEKALQRRVQFFQLPPFPITLGATLQVEANHFGIGQAQLAV
jgi:hypothetical protein